VAEALVSLSEAFPLDAAHLSVEEFRACARYYEAMDFILYLREDMPYRADRVGSFLTLLLHPHEQRAIGLKIKGCKFLFKQLQAIFRAQGRALPDDEFMPLMSILEVAMTAGMASGITDHVERKRLTKSYQTARAMAKTVRFDPRELKQAA
jgi:hypothetical protein